MPSHFVYILESSAGSYYIGYTTDIERRLQQHRSGKGSKFVRAFGFKKLLYKEELSSRSEGLKREAELKKLSREEKEALILASSGNLS